MTSDGPERGIVRKVTLAAYERLVTQLIHWGVVITIGTFIFVLRLRNALDTASVTALYGGILGHVGTAAVHRGGQRYRDDGPSGGG